MDVEYRISTRETLGPFLAKIEFVVAVHFHSANQQATRGVLNAPLKFNARLLPAPAARTFEDRPGVAKTFLFRRRLARSASWPRFSYQRFVKPLRIQPSLQFL